jgi:uncharacterized delta-60 repeat protein
MIGFPFLLWAFVAGNAVAQSALDGFSPNPNSAIYAAAIQPDGKIIIGGEFTTLSPNSGPTVNRNHIARLNQDGTVDPTFDPNANGTVWAIALQPDGRILVGGLFHGQNSIGGLNRDYIARLDSVTGLADSFDPRPNGGITRIVVQPDGKILVAGAFDFLSPNGGAAIQRNYFVRVDSSGNLDSVFDPRADGSIWAIAIDGEGRILVGGSMYSIGGVVRNLARLDAVTGSPDSFDAKSNGTVYAIAIQPDGKVVVGGDFYSRSGEPSIGGQVRQRLARLDPVTGLADSFNPNASAQVKTVAIQADGKILAGGFYSQGVTIGGQLRNGIARLDPVTGLADSFDPNPDYRAVDVILQQPDGKILIGGFFSAVSPNGGPAVARSSFARLAMAGQVDQTLLNLNAVGYAVFATAVQPDGKILIGGDFTSILGVSRNNIARLNQDGTLDSAFNPDANGFVRSIALQPDGRIVVAGSFTSIGGQPRNRIARVDAETGASDSFDPNANDSVLCIAVQPDGRILVGGLFTVVGGQGRNHIARLDPGTGTADPFNPNANNHVFTIALQRDGKVLVGGYFHGALSIGGQAREYFARLDTTTGQADSFDPSAGAIVFSIVVQPDGKIVIGGDFSSIGGQQRNWIARLDPSTGQADSFNPNANSTVYSLALQADGKILAAGYFKSIGGQLRNYIARLDPNTGLADSFDPGADKVVRSIALQLDGKVLIGGDFATVGSQPRGLLARLSNDTAALQVLSVTQSQVTWELGGANPQFRRVTVEVSSDGVTYTVLGEATATGSSWTLGNLALPTGEALYLRSQGFYSNGCFNGSGSIIESVRKVFLAASPPAPSPTPTATATATATPAATATPTPTATATATASATPTATATSTAAATATATATAMATATATATPTATATTTPTSTATTTPTAMPTATPGLVGNVSTRLPVGTGDDALIEGFIVQGPAGSTKKIMVRAIGPSLAAFGITDVLANPTLEIHDSGNATVATNNDWRTTQQGGLITGDQWAEINSSGLAPTKDLESAIIIDLAPGNYTAVVRGFGNTIGTGVVDAYDLSGASPSRLANISTRGLAQAGDKLIIAGFIVQNAPVKAVVRAIGPSLLAFGINNALADTTLDFRDQNGTVLVMNDDWKTDPQQAQELQSIGLQPSHDLEAALVTTIPPGQYTAQVRGKNDASGIGVVQVYFLP